MLNQKCIILLYRYDIQKELQNIKSEFSDVNVETYETYLSDALSKLSNIKKPKELEKIREEIVNKEKDQIDKIINPYLYFNYI